MNGAPAIFALRRARHSCSTLRVSVVMSFALVGGCHVDDADNVVMAAEMTGAPSSDVDVSTTAHASGRSDSAFDARQRPLRRVPPSMSPPDDLVLLRKLLVALQSDDRTTVSRMIPYPLERAQPLAAIPNAAEFIRHYDDFFDEKTIAAVDQASARVWYSHEETLVAWGEPVWEGLIEIVAGRIVALRVKTDKQHAEAIRARDAEAMTLHPSVRDYVAVILECENQHHHIRIHREAYDAGAAAADVRAPLVDGVVPGLRYIAWKTGSPLTSKPELSLPGGTDPRQLGSAGGGAYVFESGPYEYEVLYIPYACSEIDDTCRPQILVSLNHKLVSREACPVLRWFPGD